MSKNDLSAEVPILDIFGEMTSKVLIALAIQYIAKATDESGGLAEFNMERIAYLCDVPEKEVKQAVKILENAGIVMIIGGSYRMDAQNYSVIAHTYRMLSPEKRLKFAQAIQSCDSDTMGLMMLEVIFNLAIK
jgi:2-iminoacetate synthase ThiH